MKAIVLTAHGDVDKLELREVPEPSVGPGEIKVRVVAAGVNPIDWKLRSGALKAFRPLELPAILGRDVAGEVLEIGPGVRAFKVGARVLGCVNAGYAERVVAQIEAWAELPAKLDPVDAAALPLVCLTGGQLIEEAVNPRAGETVLVTGAVGSVGRVAVFVARARGAKVWAGVRRDQRDEAAKLGAAGVVAIDDDGELERLPPLDAIADTAGAEAAQKALQRLKPGGTLGTVVAPPPGAQERGFVVRGMVAHLDPERLARLARAVADGQLVIPIARRFPLSQAREAHRVAEKGAGGKVLLVV
jgi:NADPH:quinone reductase-like Zn-dependent oxidoreductase